MKNFCFHCIVILFISTTSYASFNDRPYVAAGIEGQAAGFAVSATTGFLVPASYDQVIYNAYTSNQGRYTALRGGIGESMMDELLSGTGDWRKLESAKTIYSSKSQKVILAREGSSARGGIDGIYMRFDKNGNPKGLIVGEAKTNGSQLRETKSGKQMSPAWRAERLLLNSQRLKIAAEAFRSGNYVRSHSKPPSDATTVPIGRNNEISYWYDKKTGKWTYYSKDPIGGKQVATKIGTLADYLEAAGKDIITYKARIFNIDVRGETIKIRFLDADTGNIAGSEISGTYKDLPPKIQDSIRESLKKEIAKEFMRKGKGKAFASNVADELVSQAEKSGKIHELINKYRPKFANWSPRIGLRPAIQGGAFGGALAGGFELVFQSFTNDSIDWERVVGISALGGGSGFTGTWVGVQTQYFLGSLAGRSGTATILSQGTKSFLPKIAGGVTGGGAASALFSYGAYALGYMDLKDANRSALSGSIGAAVGTGCNLAATGLVATFGTASTGTAISGLSGAAATNATMAWFGGGSVATGGLGAGTGAMILTGGTVVVFIAATAAVTYTFYVLDEKTERKRVHYLIKTVHNSVKKEAERINHFRMLAGGT